MPISRIWKKRNKDTKNASGTRRSIAIIVVKIKAAIAVNCKGKKRKCSHVKA
jgi:hypothetical protein